MPSETYQEVFDLAQQLTDEDSFLNISVLAIDARKCELVIKAKFTDALYKKNDTVVDSNLTYKEALLLLRGINYGRNLPT